MSKPKVLILTGYGINCEEETKFAFDYAGGEAAVIHINDIISNPSLLNDFQIFTFPGGFSYGDDTGSGKALANKIRYSLKEEFLRFIERDVLILGICNGFQVMVNMGLVPGYDMLGNAQVDLTYNSSNIYQCRWVNLLFNTNSPCVFTKGITNMHIPVAHGEGNFFCDQNVLKKLIDNNQIAARYSNPNGGLANREFPYNPNGSLYDIASICSENGRFMGMMPHPERNILFTQQDDWTLLKEQYLYEGKDIPQESEGIKIFQNAINYFG